MSLVVRYGREKKRKGKERLGRENIWAKIQVRQHLILLCRECWSRNGSSVLSYIESTLQTFITWPQSVIGYGSISLLERAYMINYIILMIIQRSGYYIDGNFSLFSPLCFLRITDLGHIKRRLYLSTVHKELSSTPLHAKIPLFMIKRKIVSITWMLLQILNSVQQILIMGLLCV